MLLEINVILHPITNTINFKILNITSWLRPFSINRALRKNSLILEFEALKNGIFRLPKTSLKIMSSFQILTPEFLPSVSYFLPFLKSTIILVADHIQYKKRSNLTRSEHGLKLTIPIKKTGFKTKIAEKKISYTENWQRKHLTRLYHLYHNHPYFDEYFYKLKDIYLKHCSQLSTFLYHHINFFTSSLKIKCDLKLTSQEGFTGPLEENLIIFSKNNSSSIFIYNKKDVQSGYINLKKLHDAKIATQALSDDCDPVLKQINILEFLFRFGPEAAFQIRDI